MACAKVLLPLGVLLASIATATANDGDPWVIDRQPFPKELSEGVVALIAIFLPLFTLALVAAAVQKPFKLAVVLSLIAALALLVTGIASWGATYQSAREIIQERTELLLERAAEIGKEYLERELGQGVLVLELMMNQVKMNQIQVKKVYPDDYLNLALIYNAMKAPDAIELIYYGYTGTADAYTRDGPCMVGVGTPKADGNVYSVWGQYDEEVNRPAFAKCPAWDRNDTATECVNYASSCGANTTLDFKCQLTCAGKANPTTGSTFPETAPEFCIDLDGDHRRLSHHKTKFSPEAGGSFTAYPDATENPYDVHSIFYYNPMIRPWWTTAPTIQMSEPYLFVGGVGVGVTMAVGAYDENNNVLGSLAVDFSLASIQPLLVSVRPTKNTKIHIAGIDGALVGSTWSIDELSADTGFSTTEVTFLDKIPNADSKLKKTFNTITSRYDGTLATAWGYRTTVHTNDRIYMSLPIDAKVARYLLVLELPYSDAMGAADEASFVSLLITIGISILMSLLMFCIVNKMLDPLRDLAQDMFDVACMKLEVPSAESRVAEVRGMQVSFKTMVEKLIEYREYLPQSVLMAGEEDDDFGESSEQSESVKVAAGARSGSTAGSKMSHMSKMSKRSAHTSMARAQEKTAFVMELKTKSSSMLCINAKDFHQFSTSKDRKPADIIEQHAAYLQVIVDASKVRKGVTEGFSGDRVTVGFNTVANLGTHRQACMAAALHIKREAAVRLPFGVNMACGSGKVYVGNMGTAGLKKFTILGDMVSTVRGFERCGRRWGIDIIAGSQIVRDLSAEFEVRVLYPVQSAGLVHTLYEVVCEVKQDDEEWMYQLEQAAAKSLFGSVNKACLMFFEGSAEEALTIAHEAKSEWAGELVQWFRSSATPTPLDLSAAVPGEAAMPYIAKKSA